MIFFGNSIILAGLRPDAFDETMPDQIESFNFALPALPIGPAYFVLKDLIKNWGSPNYVVIQIVTNSGLEPGVFDFSAPEGMGFPEEFFSYLRHRKNKVALFNVLFPMRLYTHEVAKYLRNSLLDSPDIKHAREKNRQILDQMIEDRGYYYIAEHALFPTGELPEGWAVLPKGDLPPIGPAGFDFDEDPYLKKFMDFTLKHQIKVLLIGSILRERSTAFIARRPAMFEILPSLYPNVFVAENGWQNKFLPNKYFSDETHLNPKGATLYTKSIFEEFREVFLGSGSPRD